MQEFKPLAPTSGDLLRVAGTTPLEDHSSNKKRSSVLHVYGLLTKKALNTFPASPAVSGTFFCEDSALVFPGNRQQYPM